MRIPFNTEQFKTKLREAPGDVSDLILTLDGDPLILEIAERYKLSTIDIGILVHELILVILGFSTGEDFTNYLTNGLNISPEDSQIIYKEVNLQILSTVKIPTSNQESLSTKGVVQINKAISPDKNTVDHHDTILHEIENPSPTFSTTQILKTSAVPVSVTGTGSAAIHEFHGFKPEPIAPNPAAAVATKLDKKLEEPTSHAPKEIYHIKPMDPYHEPVE